MPGTSPDMTREVVRGRFLDLLLLGKGATGARVAARLSPAPYAVMAGRGNEALLRADVPTIHVLLLRERLNEDVDARQKAKCSPDERSDIRGSIAVVPRISLRSSGLRDYALTTAGCRVS